MQCCPASRSFFPLILLGTMFQNTIKISFSNVGDQDAHPKMHHRIMVFFIVIFMFLLIQVYNTQTSAFYSPDTPTEAFYSTLSYIITSFRHYCTIISVIPQRLHENLAHINDIKINSTIILLKLNKFTLLDPVVV